MEDRKANEDRIEKVRRKRGKEREEKTSDRGSKDDRENNRRKRG